MFWRSVVFGICLIVALSFNVAAGVAGSTAQDTQLAQSGGIMKCMTQCIQHEGADAKDTCKLRCASAGGIGKERKKPDCMANYKQCKKSCPKGSEGKNCKKACKGQLTSCGG